MSSTSCGADLTVANPRSWTPAIVRLAGIGADFLDQLVAEGSIATVQALALRAALGRLRQEVAEVLYAEIPHHTAETRRSLLELRRRCFNGRSGARCIADMQGLAFQDLSLAGLLRHLEELELQSAEAELAYALEYELRRAREVAILVGPLRNRVLRRGLALASPSFSAEVDTLFRKAEESSRCSERLIHTLARYVTRSALKLSPYSTLTPVALAEITALPGSLLHYLRGSRTTSSNLRVKRYLLDQCCDVLQRIPSVRPHLEVCLNSTVRRVGEDRYRFLRPPQLQAGDDSTALTYSRYEQITVRLGGALANALLERPPRSSLSQLINDLIAVMSYPESMRGELAHAIDQLIEVGFLSLVFPVRSYDPHLERSLRDFLSALPADPLLIEISSILDEVIRLEEIFSITSDPARVASRIEAAMGDVHQRARCGLSGGAVAQLQKSPGHNIYEDCFEVSAASVTGAVLQFDEHALRMAIDAGNMVWQIAGVHETRHEFLLTLEAFLEQRFPGRGLVPVLDLFDQVRPLWEEYLTFVAEKQTLTFNPLGLSAITDLAALRLCLEGQLRGILQSTDEVDYYGLTELRQIVQGIPRRWLNPLGPSLFLQPVDPQASAWVVNRVFEGNGRLSSRYTTVMPAPIRERYLEHYRLRSSLEIEGEVAELLDLQYTKKSTANAHLPQTAKVLVMPGERLDPADAEAVELRDLFIRRQSQGALAVVNDAGRRFVPSFLCPLANPFVPSILKFLDAFGCGVRGNHQLPFDWIASGEMTRCKRQMVGNLILQRGFWCFKKALLPSPALEPGEFFLQIQRWHADSGLPSEVYLQEQVHHVAFAGEVTKPQYLRFDSVVLVGLLHEFLLKKDETVIFVEAVPRAGHFPRDPELGRRAVEIIVEWLALSPFSGALSLSPVGEIYQPAEPTLPETQEVKYV